MFINRLIDLGHLNQRLNQNNMIYLVYLCNHITNLSRKYVPINTIIIYNITILSYVLIIDMFFLFCY
jgi:hypothetical protein